MKIQLLCIGKTQSQELISLIKEYEKRLPKFINFTLIELSNIKNAKNLSDNELKNQEATLLLSYLDDTDTVILLDESGKGYSSLEFSEFIDSQMNNSTKKIKFIIGGALGLADTLKSKAHSIISLSQMTFTHQMVRLIFIEQLYRTFSILQGSPYHN